LAAIDIQQSPVLHYLHMYHLLAIAHTTDNQDLLLHNSGSSLYKSIPFLPKSIALSYDSPVSDQDSLQNTIPYPII